MMIDLDWHDPIIQYLQKGTLPTDKDEQHKLMVKSRSYLIVEDQLYRRGGPNIVMKCVSVDEGQGLLEEIH